LKILNKINQYLSWYDSVNGDVGFVPTMGALHKGHVSLVESSIKDNQFTVVSIFVNERQFGKNEDFNKYPRTYDEDLKILSKLKVDVVFIPQKDEVYSKNFSTSIVEESLSPKIEGVSRPNFFGGVLTVVSLLFNIVKPNRAYFGEKDLQQLMVVKKMVSDLKYPIKIISVKTVREQSGLAISSRNQYLNQQEQEDAKIIYTCLVEAKEKILCNTKIKTIKHEMIAVLQSKKMKVDYISFVELDSFQELNDSVVYPLAICIAVWYQKVRLIDNIIITK
tara:strand:- start:10884 stop:11717 length:834 start_codon:yes stop_codon:yes gene_type:complete